MQRIMISRFVLGVMLFTLLLGGATAQAEEYAYTTADGVVVDMLINPYPNQAPYTVELPSGDVIFNPLAIQDVRFAIHQLIDRTLIAKTIEPEAAMALVMPALIEDSDPCSLGSIAQNLGISLQANVAIALATIRRAMEDAASLPENTSRLVRGEDGLWEWDGSDISIPVGIRADHAAQNAMGHCVADALEQTGFVIERIEAAAADLMTPVYTTPLNELAWRMVTEAWGSGADHNAASSIAQFFTPSKASYGSMVTDPSTAWKYENDDLEAASTLLVASIEAGELDCNALQQVVHWGLHDAVRIFIALRSN